MQHFNKVQTSAKEFARNARNASYAFVPTLLAGPKAVPGFNIWLEKKHWLGLKL